jgi:hypothetical protein
MPNRSIAKPAHETLLHEKKNKKNFRHNSTDSKRKKAISLKACALKGEQSGQKRLFGANSEGKCK